MKFIYYIGFIFMLFTSCAKSKILITNDEANPTKTKVNYPDFKEKDYLLGTLTPLRSSYDVFYYQLSVDIDIDKKAISGTIEMHFSVLNDLQSFQIDLYENMDIQSIIYLNQPLKYTRKYNAVFVELPETLKAGNKATVTVKYSGKPIVSKLPPWEGGFVWEKDKENNPWLGVVCEGDGASMWWPLKDHITDEPDSMLMHFTVPDGLMCVSNGVLVNREKSNSKETFSWKTNYPINSYNVTFYVGKYEHFSDVYTRGVNEFPLDYYVLPENVEKAKAHFKEVHNVIAFYEKVFGPYPWYKENFKLVESPYEGMEHQSAIAYGSDFGEGMMTQFFGFDYIIVHETAHEWWGNSLTAPDFAEIWLHEGFATYSEALYQESQKGYDAYLNLLKIYATQIKNERPLIGPYGVSFFDYDDSDVYMKGALTLHTLRVYMQDDVAFFKLLKEFYQTYAYSIASTKSFMHLAEDHSGKELEWFFKQYLYTASAPVLEYNTAMDYESGNKVLKYRYLNTEADFILPLKILVNGEEMTLYPTTELQVLPIESFKVDVNLDKAYVIKKVNTKL
jgi:aminopeptidase N